MSELNEYARKLLALREKATPILGNCGCYNESDTTFRASGHDMADTIRDLIAEIERLTTERDAWAARASEAITASDAPSNIRDAGPTPFAGRNAGVNRDDR